MDEMRDQTQPIQPTGDLAGALMMSIVDHGELGIFVCIGRITVPMDKWLMVGFGNSDSARHEATSFMARFVAANLP